MKLGKAASSRESSIPANPVPENPAPGQDYDEAYQQMYEACHGPNGYMNMRNYQKEVDGAGLQEEGNTC